MLGLNELTIELVPKTCWYTNLRSELPRSQWDKLRKKAYQESDYKCQICGGQGKKHPVEAHEIWHYNDDDKKQTLQGIVALCPKCHMCKHWGLSSLRGKEEVCVRHMMKVNGWSKEDVLLYVESVFEQWHRRSQHEWDLDISWLDSN